MSTVNINGAKVHLPEIILDLNPGEHAVPV
jgi:hypothetical protein